MINAKYTVVLKTLMDNEQTKAALDKALSTYPLYEGKKDYDLIPTREELNIKILNHYKYREIGFETVGRFLDELEITMHEIMPRYNELFKSIEIMADLPNPFDNVDVVETFEQETEGTNKSNQKTTSNNTVETNTNDTSTNNTTATDETNTNTNMTDTAKAVHSETPQGQINIAAKNIDSVPYADNVNWNKNTSESNAESSGTNTTTGTTTSNGTNTTEGESEVNADAESSSTGKLSHTFTKKGNQGVNTYAHDMNEFRTAIIDAVYQIIKDKRIAELFLMVYE